MLSHTSPHNRLRGGEETALFSGFFCWNTTLALKKSVQKSHLLVPPVLLCRSREEDYFWQASLPLPSCFSLWAGLCHTDRFVSEVFTGNAYVKVNIKCCQRASVVSEGAPVTGSRTAGERERAYPSSQDWVHLWGGHLNCRQVDKAVLLTWQELLTVPGGKPIKSYFMSIRVWSNSIRNWEEAMVGDKHYSVCHLWAFGGAASTEALKLWLQSIS